MPQVRGSYWSARPYKYDRHEEWIPLCQRRLCRACVVMEQKVLTDAYPHAISLNTTRTFQVSCVHLCPLSRVLNDVFKGIRNQSGRRASQLLLFLRFIHSSSSFFRFQIQVTVP